ncbi:MAG: UDP-N-acetylmuramate dehydrogenase [Lysobacterales bacterium]|jgi:UDP-N-acetylmuramate dehydrogenase|nr:MAG: UDP-N-acetylmuramate dehydrogenase [Xanthomonadales bacterium]
MAEAYTLIEDAALGPCNTLRVAARARHYAELRDPAALPAVLDAADARGEPVLVLGEGSNVLFAGDFPGLVLRPAFAGVRRLADDGERVILRVEAGYGWDALVDWSLAQGLAGLENLALIPGLVGAAPIQNIGAYGVEVAERVVAVEAWDRDERRLRRLPVGACAFGYRDSRFKQQPERWIVTAVEFAFSRSAALRLDYAGVREELAAGGITAPTASDVAAAVRRLRRRKLPDPARIGNAGSFFKNPLVADAVARGLREAEPSMPVYPAGRELAKLSAAWLIERCGWRGHREGDAGISAQHALVLVNHGAATGAELLGLARRVADSVCERYGVRLEPEPRIVGATW